ncbi:MAG TPA: hypothetical protein VGZ01_03425 [Trinickia sp.]|nr:hypothetical protein [Trinickia sp.]
MSTFTVTHAKRRAVWLPIGVLVGLAGCSTVPSGPSVLVLPGSGKTFDQFRADDASCRQYAYAQVGGVSTNEATAGSALGSAAVGTALGAAAGAAFNGGRGAAVGAGAGLLAGSVLGAGAAQGSGYEVQRRYDYAYIQCMYASGDRVPMPRGMASTPATRYSAPPPPPPPPRY